MLITVLIFFLILSVLVLVHEAGHFFVAKFFGIKVEEFGFGIPPRIFGKKFGETLYSINWLPIGGFVKLFGEDEAGGGNVQMPDSKSQASISKEDENRAFYAKPAWQRATVVVAGVVMNFLLAVIIVSFLFSVVGVPIPGNKVVIDQVIKNSPADKAALHTGDTVISVNSIKVATAQELITYSKNHLGEEITIQVRSQKSEVRSLKITPRKVYPASEGAMGIAISQSVTIKKYPWYEAPFVGTKEVLKESAMIAMGLFGIVGQLVTKGSLPQDVAGPVGIAQLTGKFVEIGPYAVLSFISLLSINLAIVNVLPIPALDGGRLFFILFEAITRKKVNPKIEGWAHTIGMIVLLSLIALITLHDLIRVFTGQPILPQIK